MAAIKPLVASKDYVGIAQQITKMKRLWQGRGLDGLLHRRDDEANLVRHSDRKYIAGDLVRVA
jgi:GH24 family phage-related lysozyme (muramidase)